MRASGRWGRGGRYELRGPRRSGGMSLVRRVRDLETGQDLALKTLTSTADRHARRCLEREARLLATVRHEHLVGHHDHGTEDGSPYLLMEWVEGARLEDALSALRESVAATRVATAQDPAWWDLVARLFGQLCDAVAALHRAGIVHRDIKPANVLLRPDGRPVLLDLGLAARVDEADSLAGRLAGSVHYLSPEQVRGGSTGVDPRCDVHQLGAVLYELIGLQRVYDGPDRDAVLRAVAEARPRALPRLRPDAPPHLVGLCRRALQRRPNARPADARALAALLRLERRRTRQLRSAKPPRRWWSSGLRLGESRRGSGVA